MYILDRINKTSSIRHLRYFLGRCLQDVLQRRISDLRLRHLLDTARCLPCLNKTSLRHVTDVPLRTGSSQQTITCLKLSTEIRKTRRRSYLSLRMKISGRRQWRRSRVVIVTCEDISHLVPIAGFERANVWWV